MELCYQPEQAGATSSSTNPFQSWISNLTNNSKAKAMFSNQMVQPKSKRNLTLIANNTSRSAGGFKLPLEDTLYDPIGLSNFCDQERMKPGFQISKTFKTDALSNALQADLPAKVQLSYTFGTVWKKAKVWEPEWEPINLAKLAVTVRLLDLSGMGKANSGYLNLKWMRRSDDFSAMGWEIDRKVNLVEKLNTRLYGRVSHTTSTKLEGKWRMISHFGVEQEVKVLGYRIVGRVGISPELKPVFDLKI